MTVLLRRDGWHVNAKRIYRLYREEDLIVRTKQRRKPARRQRAATIAMATRVNQRSSMDFVSDKSAMDALSVFSQSWTSSRGNASGSKRTGRKVAEALERAQRERGSLPESITVDNDRESNGTKICEPQQH